MQVGQTYRIKIDVSENADAPKLKYVPATLVKEFQYFYLFQTKNYKTAINKCDSSLIEEA